MNTWKIWELNEMLRLGDMNNLEEDNFWGVIGASSESGWMTKIQSSYVLKWLAEGIFELEIPWKTTTGHFLKQYPQ